MKEIMKKAFVSVLKIVLLVFCIVSEIKSQNCFSICSDFPGGNGLIEKISGDTVYLRADLRDTDGDWFYWNFAVKNAGGKKLYFTFNKPNRFTDQGPAVSKDKGMSWAWMGASSVISNTFSYSFQTNDEIRFSMSMPYTQKNFDAFISPFLKNKIVCKDTLCFSKKGRAVERVYINRGLKKAAVKVVFTARHHACEMMADYVMEGIIEAVANDPSLKWLRTNAEFVFIPFVDKDGVEDGDQGKNRKPRDHNRDYADSSLYNETTALRKFLPGWSEGKASVTFDLHCPYIQASHDKDNYIVGSKDQQNAEQQEKFAGIMNDLIKKDTLLYRVGFLPYGTAWNTGSSFQKGRSFTTYCIEELKSKLSASFEFPYGSFSGIPASPARYRLVGKHIAYAVQAYLTDMK